MRKGILTGFFAAIVFTVFAQKAELTLKECYRLAMENHPLTGQNVLYEQASRMQSEILDIGNLPQLNLTGQASYQNTVTEFPFQIPGISMVEIPHEQYKVNLNITQVVYGGGITKGQQQLEKSGLAINKKTNESDLYRLKERISQVYFSILLTEQTLSLYQLSKEELTSRLKKVETSVKNGVLLPQSEFILQAEILNVEQKEIEIRSQKSALIAIMEVLTGSAIQAGTIFPEPEITFSPDTYVNLRPEYALFDLQKEKMDMMKSVAKARRNPRLFAYADAGYGRPGLNMFNEKADEYFILGARLSWNIWNWDQTRKEMKILDIQKELVDTQKKAFDNSTQASVQQYLEDVKKIRELLENDDAIIGLRKSITLAASTQLENGVITATEYITEYNMEIQARLARSLHEVQLLQAMSAYQSATGNL